MAVQVLLRKNFGSTDSKYIKDKYSKKSSLYCCTVLFVVCVCVCVFFLFFLDIKFVGRTSQGHTGGRSHRISHPPSFCGACLNFYREKDSAVPFPRRLRGRILCTSDLIVLHPLGIFSLVFFFSFLVRKIPFAGIELMSQHVRGLRGTSEVLFFFSSYFRRGASSH